LHVREATRVLLEDCEFVDLPQLRGAAIIECLDMTVRGCSFIRCGTVGTNQQGGALLVSQSTGIIEFCTFAYDSARVAHGGALDLGITTNVTVANNTFYRCYSAFLGSAVSFWGTSTTVRDNVVVDCQGAALARFQGTIHPSSGCNLLWNNSADYYDWPAQAMLTDIHADPLFCDPEVLDLSVQSNSPAVPPHSAPCGAIGAHGVGCGLVGIEGTSWGKLKSAFRDIEGRSSE
jgi:hypothetical protein